MKKQQSKGIIERIKNYLDGLNNSKFFAGVMMIILNLGAKYINVDLTDTQEEFLKQSLSRQLLVFSFAWMGTRDIILSIILTASFTILASYLLNEDSNMCVIPGKLKKIKNVIDKNKDGIIQKKELDLAINTLQKYQKQNNNNLDI